MTEEKKKVGTAGQAAMPSRSPWTLSPRWQAEEAPAWAVSAFTAEYERMYLSDLETMAPAGGPTSEMQLVFAPVEPK